MANNGFIHLRRFTKGLVVGFVFFCLCGPSAFSSGTSSIVSPRSGPNEKISWPEPELGQAFEKYWNAFAREDMDACLEMEAPHFRFVVDRGRYLNYFNIVSKGDVTRVEILEPLARAPFFAEVPMWLIKTSPSGEAVRIGMKDRWVKVQGRWYHVIRDPLVFPGV